MAEKKRNIIAYSRKAVFPLALAVAAAIFTAGCRTPDTTPTDPFRQEVTGTGVFVDGSEPEGFRGIRWGTDIKTFQNLEFARTDPSFGGIDTYTSKNETLLIAGVEVAKIEYSFWQDKLCNVWVYTTGRANWDRLIHAFSREFGPPSQPHMFIENYRWTGNKTKIRMEYDDSTMQGTIAILSAEKFRRMRRGI